jgi:hypothetical protein
MTESNDKVAQRESGELDPSGVESDLLEKWPGEHKERSFQSFNAHIPAQVSTMDWLR